LVSRAAGEGMDVPHCHTGNSWTQLCPEDTAPALLGTQRQTPFLTWALLQEARPEDGVSWGLAGPVPT
jgi:hypothetical protein